MHSISLLLAIVSCGFALLVEEQFTINGDGISTASTIRDALIGDSIIPDVIDDFEPKYHVDVEYPRYGEKVLLGNNITVKHVKKRPTFTIYELEIAPRLDRTYTLILTDPDAKSREDPKWSEMCHWIITNLTTPIPGQPPQFENRIEGELVEYAPPGPPPKTGYHRYVFVLLEGDTTELQPPRERKHWGYGKARHGIRDWAKENGLTVVAANHFFAKNKKQ